MDRTPAPVSLTAARALQPPEDSRAAEVFRDDHVWIRFAARPTSGPQVPHDRDEFYIVASGTARYRWDGGETMIGPGDMMFAAAHAPTATTNSRMTSRSGWCSTGRRSPRGTDRSGNLRAARRGRPGLFQHPLLRLSARADLR
jgi:mannose-6-phosphate isomerase-like protein (cupin superfamily)